jgi:hypothetical protein
MGVVLPVVAKRSGIAVRTYHHTEESPQYDMQGCTLEEPTTYCITYHGMAYEIREAEYNI